MRGPQVLKNSPLHLKLLMDTLFGHMCNVVIHYTNEIMIATKGTFEEHMKAVPKVFSQMEKDHLHINSKKVLLAQESIEFLEIIWKKDHFTYQMQNYQHSKHILYQQLQKEQNFWLN
jgi:hypothetical protein